MSLKNSPDKLVVLQRQLAVLVLSLIGLLLTFQLCAYFADILRILGISILFSYLLITVVDRLNIYIHSRIAALIIVYTIVIVSIIFGALFFVPVVMSQITQLISTTYEHLPQLVGKLTQAMVGVEQRLHAARIELKTIDILNNFVSSMPKIEAGLLFTRVSDVALSTMTGVFYTLSILVISFYFLLDGYSLPASFIRLFPRKYEPDLKSIAFEIDRSLQAFFRGQIILGFGFGLVMILVFLCLGVRYALLLGLVLAIWEVIPVIGPPIGFIPTLIAVLIHGMDNVPCDRFTQILIVVGLFYGFQWLKDNIVGPRYIGNVIGLHPVTIFVAIMLGARIDGMLGVIFALPAACAINVLVNHHFKIAGPGPIETPPT
jgi:predicted PurR-regulated permease PerM